MFTRPYIIAELSGNHNGDINRALTLIELAKEAGANAVKLQTYTADTITIDCDRDDFFIKNGIWNGYKLHDLYKQAHTPWEWHEALFEKAKTIGITLFSTPFDESAVDFLEKLETPLYKIASFEMIHHPLIAYVAKTNKPIIMSTGMGTLEEIKEAVDVAFSNGCQDLTLLHCISEYPTPITACNLAMIVDLEKQFPQCSVGLSDHTLGTTVAIAAVALGATVIEKHFTLDRKEGGVDSKFSIEPGELKQLCHATKDAALAIGQVNYQRTDGERNSMARRQSIYAVRTITKGNTITKEDIRIIRPGYGVKPKYYDAIIGSVAKKDYEFGMPISDDQIRS